MKVGRKGPALQCWSSLGVSWGASPSVPARGTVVPVGSPDGHRIAFVVRDAGGGTGVFDKPSKTGGKEQEPLLLLTEETSGPTIGRAMGVSCSFPAWIEKRNLIRGCCL